MYDEIVKRLHRYTENCVAYKLDADFADAVQKAADAIEELNRTHDESAAYQRGLDDAWEAARKKSREEDARKSAAEMEKLSAEIKLALANRIASMNEEQLAAFNKALEEPKKEYVPIYIPSYPVYNQLPMVPYSGPRWWANP